MPNLLWFEWERDADGYEIVELGPDNLGEGNTVISISGTKVRLDHELLSAEVAHLVKRIRYPGLGLAPEIAWPQILFVARGNATLRYRPLDRHPGLFREFADLEQTPESTKAFADKYGLLFPGKSAVLLNKEFYPFIDTIKDLTKSWERAKSSGEWKQFIERYNKFDTRWVGPRLAQSRDTNRPALHIVPNNLFMAMWLQAGQIVSSNHNLRRCAWCPTWFVFGVGTGRRKSAHYCSDRCLGPAAARSLFRTSA